MAAVEDIKDDVIAACDPMKGCGRGQNCIVIRRMHRAVVVEDEIYIAAGVSVRASCDTSPTEKQLNAMLSFRAAAQCNSIAIE